MRILLVEDKVDFARAVEQALEPLEGCEVVWARSRDAALRRLEEEYFDLVILDRRIPSDDDVLDDSADHGFRVFQNVREEHGGLPLWFLTATEDADFAAEIANDFGRSADLHGQNSEHPLYMVVWKKRLDHAIARVRQFAEHRAAVERIALVNPNSVNLTLAEERNVRIFGRRFGATSIEILPLGGLSGARVLKVMLRDAAGGLLHTAVAKLASLAAVRDENRRYVAEISRLQQGGYPALTLKVDAGTAGLGGLYYGIVGPEVTSLFKRLAAGDKAAAQSPSRMQEIEAPWLEARTIERVSVGQVRRRFMADTKMPKIASELRDIDVGPTEAVTVHVAKCAQHNDLHGENIVFDASGQCMIIDYNDAGASFASVDPITLELSAIFHKDYSKLGTEWPTVEHIANWTHLDAYLEGCKFPDFIRACRRWAHAVAASPEEVLAVAYAYAVRQLKYEDTRKDLARALIRACSEGLSPRK